MEMSYSKTFDHTRPNGERFFTILPFFSIEYSTAGENIAWNYQSAASVVEGWKNSEGHYKNMINSNFNKLGVGLCDIENGNSC